MWQEYQLIDQAHYNHMAVAGLETNSNNKDDFSNILHIPDGVIVLVKQYDVCILDELMYVVTCAAADGLC